MARSRIRSSSDFRAIYGGKSSVRNRELTVYYREAPDGISRLGLSVGRRLGNAVARNRIKRVLREVFRVQGDAIPRALDLVGEEYVTSPDGERHAWRSELCGRLVAMQARHDGSWINRNSPRWWEGNPILATAYALLTLHAALPPAD